MPDKGFRVQSVKCSNYACVLRSYPLHVDNFGHTLPNLAED